MQLKQFYKIVTKVSSRKKCYYFWWSTWLIKYTDSLMSLCKKPLHKPMLIQIYVAPGPQRVNPIPAERIYCENSNVLAFSITSRQWNVAVCRDFLSFLAMGIRMLSRWNKENTNPISHWPKLRWWCPVDASSKWISSLDILSQINHSSPPRQNGCHFADDIFKLTYWMKNFDFWPKCHWSLFLRVQLTITQHWF